MEVKPLQDSILALMRVRRAPAHSGNVRRGDAGAKPAGHAEFGRHAMIPSGIAAIVAAAAKG